MLVRNIHNSNEVYKLVAEAKEDNPQAQSALYDKFSAKMLSVCRMYTKDLQFAEDVMIKAFMKAFQNIKQYQAKGSFEGWLRQIMIREAIDFLRKQKPLSFTDTLEDVAELSVYQETNSEVEHLQCCIDQLPDGYKVVFVLYAIEGYSHKEIAKELGISEGTSKSQLHKARKALQVLLNKENKEHGYGR